MRGIGIVAALALGSLTASAEALELWLARGENCEACLIYQRVAQARGYRGVVRHAGLEIPILSIDKNVLAADVLEQLPDDVGPTSPSWDTTLTVLVMDVGRVVFAASIAESADERALRLPDAVMFPPDAPDDGPVPRVEDLRTQFFAREWNLEYFVDVALGRIPRRAAVRLIDLAAPEPAALGARNVVLWGSASTPLENSLLTPTRIEEIRSLLGGAGFGDARYVTLHGHGPNVAGNDTSYVADGRIRFARAELQADYAADAAGLNAVLTGVARQSRSRTLLVQVGHSRPDGAPLWGHGLTLLPADLERVWRESSNVLVMVSGACDGGQFATAPTCGFFAAHPAVRSSACEIPPQAHDGSDDYLRHFFRAAIGAADGNARRSRALPTLHDAHWYASTRLADDQVSYTTTDALIDAHFAAHPDALPASLSVAEIRSGAASLSPAEAQAAAALTDGLAPDLPIPLTVHVGASVAAEETLAGSGENSSVGDRSAALPYKLVLPLLARRVAYSRLGLDDRAFAAAASCERQSLRDLLGAAAERGRR